MFKIYFYITAEGISDAELVMDVQIRQGPVPAPGDQIAIGHQVMLVETRAWHYQDPDFESIRLNVYGRWL